MHRLLFVCHGNICRSPMAEYLMRHLLQHPPRDDVFVASAATSREEIGNGLHPGTKRQLQRMGIATEKPHAAHQITLEEASQYDLILAMDQANITNLKRMLPESQHSKIKLLLSYAGEHRSIADPWYTGDFEQTYNDILKSCTALLATLS